MFDCHSVVPLPLPALGAQNTRPVPSMVAGFMNTTALSLSSLSISHRTFSAITRGEREEEEVEGAGAGLVRCMHTCSIKSFSQGSCSTRRAAMSVTDSEGRPPSFSSSFLSFLGCLNGRKLFSGLRSLSVF